MVRRLIPALGAAVLAVSGCGCGSAGSPSSGDASLPPLPPSIGMDARYRPPSLGPHAARAQPIGALHCTRAERGRFGAHLELFADGNVVLVAPGIGIAPPRTRRGAYVAGGRCSYPLRTREPTGVVEVAAGTSATLGQLFDVWGQPLSRRRMAGFRSRVRAYVAGVAWRGDPRAIPLTRHAQIVVEVGRYVRPHMRYLFPPGL